MAEWLVHWCLGVQAFKNKAWSIEKLNKTKHFHIAATLFPNGEIFQNNAMYQKAWALKNTAWFNCSALSSLLPNLFLAKSLRSEQSRAVSVHFAGLHYMLVHNIYLSLWFSFLIIFFPLRRLHCTFIFLPLHPFLKKARQKRGYWQVK